MVTVHKEKSAQTYSKISGTTKHGESFRYSRWLDVEADDACFYAIKFDCKPCAETRSVMRESGWSWNPREQSWRAYGYADSQAPAVMKGILTAEDYETVNMFL